MIPAGSHVASGSRRGPQVVGQAIHELGARDTEPTTNAAAPLTSTTAAVPIVPDLLDDGAVETSQALVPINSNASAITVTPDLLDDEAIETSQALVPADNNSSAITVHPPSSVPAEKTEDTPVIAGIGKIKRNNAPRQPKPKKERIIVPERSINGGLDFKFETDPANIDLCDLLTEEDYTDSITILNDTLRPSRSKTVDAGLLVTGPLILPLALWGVRHSKQVKKRKLLLVQAIQDFNDAHSTLYMRYNRPGNLNFLSIERRKPEHSPMLTGVEESWMNHEPIV